MSCSRDINVNSFITPATLIDEGVNLHKPSLVYLYSPDCLTCELLEYKVLKDQKVIDYLNKHFLFYKIDITKELFFNRLLYFYGAPVLLVVEDDKIQSIISQADDVNKFLFALKNYRMMPLELSLAPYTNFKGDDQLIVKTINEIFSILYHLEKGDRSTEDIKEALEQSIRDYPCFYNQYLLAGICDKSESELKEHLENNLIQNTSGLAMMLFAPEIQSMMDKRFNLNGQMKAQIEFEHVKHNFGEIKYNEVVAHKFPFKNTSAVPLVIYTVTSSCGCTVPRWKRQPILPGEVDSLDVYFSASALGNNVKSVNVITNGKNRNTMLTINALVK